MRKLVYHVAVTLDNFIAHHDGTARGFIAEGDHVTDYLNHLKKYDTVVMGKGTYEAGYHYGMKPGDAPYPHMHHYIFSKTLQFEETPDPRIEIIRDNPVPTINNLKSESGTDIYLCGGGSLAGYLLEEELIDQLTIKLHPILLGKGISLFGASEKNAIFNLVQSKTYGSGVMQLTYDIDYSRSF